jgi:hypothetical protein
MDGGTRVRQSHRAADNKARLGVCATYSFRQRDLRQLQLPAHGLPPKDMVVSDSATESIYTHTNTDTHTDTDTQRHRHRHTHPRWSVSTPSPSLPCSFVVTSYIVEAGVERGGATGVAVELDSSNPLALAEAAAQEVLLQGTPRDCDTHNRPLDKQHTLLATSTVGARA